MMGVFKKFYDSRTQSRVLKWVHSLGTATLIARFPKGEKELSMNAYQACICLLYNNATVVMAGDMEKQLQLSWEEIKKNLHTLAFGKYKVLIKAQPGKDIKENDEFQINDDFQDRVRKIKIPTMVAKFNPKNTQQVCGRTPTASRFANFIRCDGGVAGGWGFGRGHQNGALDPEECKRSTSGRIDSSRRM